MGGDKRESTAAMTQSILIRSDEKRQKSKRRSRRGRRGFYSSDELIKLWSNKKSQECPPLPAIVMKVHEVKEKVIFPIQKEKDELPQELKAIKSRIKNKKIHGRPRDYYSHNGFDYKV